jgi:hypothetical protein
VADLWDKNRLECGSLFVVCSKRAARYITGPQAVLSRSERHGLLRTKESELIALHIVARKKIAVIARQQAAWGKPSAF